MNFNLKKPENLSPEEIKLALSEVIKANIGIVGEEAIKEVARLLGFRSTSAKLKGVIQPIIETVCVKKRVSDQERTNLRRFTAG